MQYSELGRTSEEYQKPIETTINGDWEIPQIIVVEDFTKGGFFGGVRKVVCESQSFALKRYDASERNHLVFKHLVFKGLAQNGFRGLGSPIPNKNGDNLPSINGSIWELSEWVEGRKISELSEEEIDSGVSALADTLTAFHATTAHFPIDGSTPRDFRMTDLWIPELIERYRMVAGLTYLGALPYFLQPYSAEIMRFLDSSVWLARAVSDKNSIDSLEDKLPKTVIHGDTMLTNIILQTSGNNYCVLIDFDRMTYGRRIDDIATIVAELERKKKGAGREFVNAYDKRLPLTQVEIDNLDFLVRYGVVRRLMWYLDELISTNDPHNDYPLVFKDELEWATKVVEG